MPLICPVDHALMTPRFYFGVEVDVCPKCGGIWMDDGELTRLGQAAGTVLREIDENHAPATPRIAPRPDRQLRCPRDGEAMSGYRFAYNSGITLDTCPACNGVFIEDDELTQIQAFKERGMHGGPDLEKVEAMRAKRHREQFGDPNERKLPEEAAIMLATMQGQAAQERERTEEILRLSYGRRWYGGGLFGILLDELFHRPVGY